MSDALTFAKLASPTVHADPDHDFTVVIPTIGKSDVVPPSYAQLLRECPPRTRIVVVINPADEEDAEITAAMVRAMGAPAEGTLDVLEFDGPIGFGGAINCGFAYALQKGGLGRTCVIFNDDIRATPGWLESLDATLHDPAYAYINLISSIPDRKTGERQKIDRQWWGKVGIVGPVTTVAAGVQGCIDPEDVKAQGGHSRYAMVHRGEAGEEILSATFLSGYLMAFHRDCLAELMVPCPLAGFGPFDSAGYPIAGYEDNDICARARDLGWRLAVDWSNYVGHIGHQSFDAAFPDMGRGMRNRFRYYQKWAPMTQRAGQRLIGSYRVRIGSVHDLHLLKASLTRHASILDGVSILLTNNPARDMPAYPDWKTLNQLGVGEQRLMQVLQGTVRANTTHAEDCDLDEDCTCHIAEDDWRVVDDVSKLRHFIELWVVGVLAQAPGSRMVIDPEASQQVRHTIVEIWTGDFNERDERNRAIENAYKLGPDWLWSIDGDECIEDRIKRGHFERYMTHPDPLVASLDFAWLDHWNDSQHFRTDAPWGDGGRYEGGRHGRRMWRASTMGPSYDRILLGTANGLHCGNLPDMGPMSIRTTGARFRHFGYVRQLDRMERFKRYQQLDPNPDPDLIGGATYGHIISAEGMRIEYFNAHNGIGLHMLVYQGTDPGNLAALLDQLYTLVDHIVIVWTDDEDPEEAMSDDLRACLELFKCDLLHAKLRDSNGAVNFAAVRNAAIDHLAMLNEQHGLGLGWGLFFDPDEAMPMEACITIRRAAEATETYGWMFRFNNPLRTGQNTPSESIRLHRLEPVMRMRNRVHESFDMTTRRISAEGGRPAIRVMRPHVFHNAGLADASRIDAKLQMYAKGLLAELDDNPTNGGAWHSLGLQLEAEDRLDEAMACYTLAIQTSPASYIGYRAVAAVKLREALAFIEEAVKRLSPEHDWYKVGVQIRKFLRAAAVPTDNPATIKVLDGVTLPAPPTGLGHLGDALQAAVRDAQAAVEVKGDPAGEDDDRTTLDGLLGGEEQQALDTQEPASETAP